MATIQSVTSVQKHVGKEKVSQVYCVCCVCVASGREVAVGGGGGG